MLWYKLHTARRYGVLDRAISWDRRASRSLSKSFITPRHHFDCAFPSSVCCDLLVVIILSPERHYNEAFTPRQHTGFSGPDSWESTTSRECESFFYSRGVQRLRTHNTQSIHYIYGEFEESGYPFAPTDIPSSILKPISGMTMRTLQAQLVTFLQRTSLFLDFP